MDSSEFPLLPRVVKGSIRATPKKPQIHERVLVRVYEESAPEPAAVTFDKAKRPVAKVVTLKRVRRSSRQRSSRSGNKQNGSLETRGTSSRSARRRARRFDVMVCLVGLCIFAITAFTLNIQNKKFFHNSTGSTLGIVSSDILKEPHQNADEVIQAKLAAAKAGAQKAEMPDPAATQSPNSSEEKYHADDAPVDPLGSSWAPGAAIAGPVPAAQAVTIPVKKFDLNSAPPPLQ